MTLSCGFYMFLRDKIHFYFHPRPHQTPDTPHITPTVLCVCVCFVCVLHATTVYMFWYGLIRPVSPYPEFLCALGRGSILLCVTFLRDSDLSFFFYFLLLLSDKNTKIRTNTSVTLLYLMGGRKHYSCQFIGHYFAKRLSSGFDRSLRT